MEVKYILEFYHIMTEFALIVNGTYRYVRIDDYPTNNEKYATDFKTVEAAQNWWDKREI